MNSLRKLLGAAQQPGRPLDLDFAMARAQQLRTRRMVLAAGGAVTLIAASLFASDAVLDLVRGSGPTLAQGVGSQGGASGQQTIPEALTRIAFARSGQDGGVFVMKGDGTGIRQITDHNGDAQPAWSPDGQRLAFVRFDQGNASIYSADLQSGGVTQLTNSGADSSPAWSPDGRKIVFSRESTMTVDLYSVSADGGKVRQLTQTSLAEIYPSWSPDGTKIAFSGFVPGSDNVELQTFVMPADGSGLDSDASPVGPAGLAEPVWSPDGSQIAAVGTESGSIYVMSADGSNVRELATADRITGGLPLTHSPSWSPDGTRISFSAGRNAWSTQVYIVDADGSDTRQRTAGDVTAADPAWGI